LKEEVLHRVVELQVERDGGALSAFLADPDPRVRARAAFALASVQDPRAGEVLVRSLRDPDASVRRDAAFAIGQLPDAGYGQVLLGALEEETDPDTRLRLLEAVGKAGDERTLERLLGVVVPPGEAAAKNLAVSRMGVRGVVLPSGIQFLVSALKDPDPRARENAGYYFGRSSAPGPWVDVAPGVRAALDSLPPSDLLAMHLLLGLANLGDPQDTPRFLWWLRSSPDWRIRANAARATGGRTSDPRIREGLFEALEDPSTHVASYAASSLAGATQMSPREREALKDWVDGHWEDWRRAGPILSLLGRVGDGAFILDWLGRWGEEDIPPRTRGLGALAFVPGDAAMDVLVEGVGSPNSRIRGTALGGLARRWRVEKEDPSTHDVYFQAFASGLRSGDPASVYVAAPALADSAFLPLGSLGLLQEAYRTMSVPEDLDGMRAILSALGETGVSEVEPFLLEVGRSPDASIQAAAAGALARLRGEDAERSDGVKAAERRVDWEALARLGSRPRLVLETEKGVVVLTLDTENAPLTVQTIAGFAQEGKYDGVPFHRVVPNFVVQGGDFARKDGYGGPGFSIRSEFTETPYLRGVLGMASSGKDTEGSQFFITHSMQPHLDGGYTVFGWVTEGMDVVDELYEEDLIVTARVEVGAP
jgi:peptidylprolyl isomerase